MEGRDAASLREYNADESGSQDTNEYNVLTEGENENDEDDRPGSSSLSDDTSDFGHSVTKKGSTSQSAQWKTLAILHVCLH